MANYNHEILVNYLRDVYSMELLVRKIEDDPKELSHLRRLLWLCYPNQNRYPISPNIRPNLLHPGHLFPLHPNAIIGI